MRKDSANLDFLRAWAVLTVYVAHIFQMAGWKTWGPLSNEAFAQMGVLIFFVHTSLVLMLSMDRMNLPPASLFKAFYIRRAFRIYPLSAVVVVLVAIFSIPSFPTRAYQWVGWRDFASNILLTQNLTFSPSIIGPLWSLPFEIQMYIVLPVLYLLLKAFPYWWVPVALWVASALCVPLQRATIARLSILEYVPCFMGGILAFALLRYRSARLPFWGWPVTILVAFAIRQAGFEIGWVACLLLGAAAPQFVELTSPWLRKTAAWIAKYSYGIYLSHVIVFWIAFVLLRDLPLVLQCTVCAVLSLVLPVAMFHLIEKPMISVGIRLTSGFTRPRAKIAAAFTEASMNVKAEPGTSL